MSASNDLNLFPELAPPPQVDLDFEKMGDASIAPEVEPVAEESWEEKRRRYLGGSDSASMFADPRLPSFGQDGIKYGCARRLIFQKRGVPPDFQHTTQELEMFERGHELEPIVAAKFRRENGLNLKVIRSAPHRMSKTHAHAGVNLDYQIVGVSEEQILNLFGRRDAASGPGYLECKTANEYVFDDVADAKGAIVDYVFQVQHGLAVKGWDWGIFAVLGFGAQLWRLSWFPVLADKRLGDRILERTEEIWAMVEDRAEIPPPLPQPDPLSRCQNCQFRKSCLGSAFVPALPKDGDYIMREDLTETAREYRQQAVIATTAEKRKKELAKVLMKDIVAGGRFLVSPVELEAGDKPVQLAGGRIVFMKDLLDEKALRNEQPEIASKYTRSIPIDYIRIWERGRDKEE
jgi:predicted phage-related endonuclease